MALLRRIEDLAVLVHPGGRLRRGLELLRDCLTGRLPDVASEVASLQPGETRRVPVDGDALYLLPQCYRTRPRTEGRFEAHQCHTDLQYVWSGRERIEVCDLRAVQSKPAYDANGNVHLPINDTAHTHLLVAAGDVAVLFPQDPHAPCLSASAAESELVRKSVVKIQDAHLPDSGSGAEVDSSDTAAVETGLAGPNKRE
jgi:YhcH/YjgK/YiaL family protein